jgi:ABC-type uncharacterized transport system ATPase subunit
MGQKIVLAGPSEARNLGIGMVFQHFTLFENLNVADRKPENRTGRLAAASQDRFRQGVV